MEWQKQLVITSFIFYPKHFRVFASLEKVNFTKLLSNVIQFN